MVRLRRLVSADDAFERRLLAGKRSCPPEDCGGVPGYHRCLDLAEGNHEADADLEDWLAGWDPDAFDVAIEKLAFAR